MRKWLSQHTVLKNLMLDVCLTICALMVFALFHHVLPKEGKSLGIVTGSPGSPSTAAAAEFAARETAAPEAEATIAPTRVTTVYSGAGETGARRQAAQEKKRGSRSGGGNVPSSKGGSALDEGETSGSETSEEQPMAEKFSDRFTSEVVTTDSSYSSPDISITVSEQSALNGRVKYYLADIYVRDIACFQTALAEDTYGSGFRDSVSDVALINNALLAVNGDYYGNTTEGVVVRNGVIYRANQTSNDVCVLYCDGTMRVMNGADFSVEEAVSDGAWQAWTFGPALLDANGNAVSSFSSSSFITGYNPRTAIGYYEPGHYCLVVVDGRGESQGMTLAQLSALFESLGCRAAYNLDGGKSSVMVWQGEVCNDPTGGGRESSDALIIAEVNKGA